MVITNYFTCNLITWLKCIQTAVFFFALNLSGFLCHQIKDGEYQVSRVFTFVNFLKLIVNYIFLLNALMDGNLKELVIEFSNLSVFAMISLKLVSILMLVLTSITNSIQFLKRHKISKFMNLASNFLIKTENMEKFKKNCFRDFILLSCPFFTFVLAASFILINVSILSLILCIILSSISLINLAVTISVKNFEHFIVSCLIDLKNDV